jgi:MFS family permease
VEPPQPNQADKAAGAARDFRLLLATRLLRAFAFGFAAVLLGLQLEHRHLRPEQIGITLAVGLLAASLLGLPAAAAARRFGRRPVLAACGLLMAFTGLDLAFATDRTLLILAGASGMLGAGVDLGPFLPIEQAMLAESAAPDRQPRQFGHYSLTGGLAAAAGALAAALATSPQRLQDFFGAFAVVGLVTAALPLFISSRSESASIGPMLSRSSLRPLTALSALFALDALGGGFVVQPVIAYWLHVRFGAGSNVLGPAFAAIAIAQAASFELAPAIAKRIGLIRTMVFTHLPSNVLLLLVPFSPSLPVATALLIIRYSISQMDVPTRQAYVVSIVPPGERAGALALTGSVRGVAQAIGPVLAGLAIQAAAFGLPFFAGGGLKIAYDLSLYAIAGRTRRRTVN